MSRSSFAERGVIVVLTLALVAAGFVVAPREAAAQTLGDDCAPNSSDTSIVPSQRCVAEMMRSVRRYRTLGDCAIDPKALNKSNPLYTKRECRGGPGTQAEAIAHARYLAWLDATGALPADEDEEAEDTMALPGGISANKQWEVAYPGGRPDVIVYNRDNPDGSIEIVELKQRRGPQSESDAAAQLNGYLATFPAGPNGRQIVARDVDGYIDYYRIKIQDCDEGFDRRIVAQFQVRPGIDADGLLMIDRSDVETHCPDDDVLDPIEEEEPIDEELPEDFEDPWEPPTEFPAAGRDSDRDGKDDFFERFLLEHPELIDLEWPELPEIPVPDEETILVGGAVIVGLVALCALTPTCLVLGSGALAGSTGSASLGAVVGLLGTALAGLGLLSLWGDPHMITLDRLQYDLQSVGEFHLLEIPNTDVDVQARFRAAGSRVSVLDRVATEIDEQRIELVGSRAYVNGEDLGLASGGMHPLGDGAFIARNGNTLMVVWPGGGEDRLAMTLRNGRDVAFHVPQVSDLGTPRGLLGDGDGNRSNDLALRNGALLPAPVSKATLHGAFADSWRITDEESLFTYAAGTSTATYTDRSFPQNIVTIGDFSENEVDAATQSCQAGGVEPGPQFDGCILDLLVTGDETYVQSAALVDDVVVSTDALGFGADGAISVDFEGEVPPNFSAARFSDDPATTRLAGPLVDGNGYRAYVRDVPRHDSATLHMEFVTFGPVQTDGREQRLDLEVNDLVATLALDGAPAVTGDLDAELALVGTGTAANGDAVHRFALDVALQPVGESLDVQIDPAGFKGIFGTAFGIDDIHIGLAVPAPDSFAVEMPFQAPGTQAPDTTGAGSLESPGAADEYSFTLPVSDGDRPLVINTITCTTGLTYLLHNGAGQQVARWANGCRRVVSNPLPAGDYTLSVTPHRSASSGDYHLEVFSLPDPQRFDAPLGTLVAEGAPLEGAGNLETVVSVDEYRFDAPGGSVYFDHRACAEGLRWSLFVSGDEVPLASGRCADREFASLPAGTYVLRFETDAVTAGSYSFQLFSTPVPPQEFTVDLPLTAAADHPASGAGTLENYRSVDRYQFSLSVGAPVYVDPIECLADGSLVWSIIGQDGAEEATGGCEDQETPTLPAGDHTLVVSSTDQGRGDYYLQAWAVPLPAETFDVALPAQISQDRPGPGAGNLETKASVDIYSFTVSDPDSATYIDEIECSSPGILRWQLIQEVAGVPVSVADGGCDSSGVRQLAQGDYRLEVSAAGDHRGTYALRIIASEAGSPEILHVPMPTAYYGKAVPIDVSTSCATDQCSAQLHYRETSHSAVSALGFSAGGWTSVDMDLTGTVPLGQEVVHRWTAAIPGTAVTTTGIDYYVTASDGADRNEFPTSVATPGGLTQPLGDITEGLLGQPYLHITTVSPPLLTHVPQTIAQADTDLPLELRASCSTGSCVATLHYRTSAGLAPGTTELFGDPGWTTITMNPTATLPLGDIGESLTYRAVIPAEDVDTRGLDYYFEVADGHTTSWWPGTVYQGYYAPLDGMRTGYHTVHVLENPHIVHAPVATTPYRSPTAITATSNCPKTRNCTARLYYRTTTVTGDIIEDSVLTEKDYTEAPMTVSRVGSLGDNDIISVSGVIPASYADTRGIDYFFRIDDGSTTAWFPGTSHVQGYVNLEGTRVAFQHIRVLEQPHVTPEPVLATEALEDFTITSGMTCATEFCSLTLHWRNDLEPGATQDGWRSVPMQPIGAPTSTPVGAYQRYEYTIPAEEVTTRGIAYYLEADDGYVHEFAPGTSYWGAYLPIDGQPVTIELDNGNGGVVPIGAFIVRVLERPHPVHVPPLLMPSGQPLPLTATSNCSSPACSATLTWTGQDGVEQTIDMVGERTLDGDMLNPIVPGDLWSFDASLPATATTGQLSYRITVSDGYTSESTIDFIATPSPLPIGLPPLGL